MQDQSDVRTTPPSHLAAVLAAIVIGGLLFAFVSSESGGDGAGPAAVRLADLPISDPAHLEGRSGRVILLEDYVAAGSGLDSLIVEGLLAPQLLPEEEYASPIDRHTASAYLAQISEYKTLLDLQSFGEAGRRFADNPDKPVPDNVREQFNEVPGGRLVLESLGNPVLLREFSRLTMMANERMKGLEFVRKIAALYRTEWGLSDGPAPLSETAGADEAEAIRQALRLWELEGDRYVVCHSGNPVISRFVQSMFPGTPRPVYANGLNAVLDPGGRRFSTVATYWPENPAAAAADGGAAPASGTRMVPVAEGPFALVEFKGALPPAKLYADWVVDESSDSARATLMSPGFNPQRQVLVRKNGTAVPDRPAAEVPPLAAAATPNGGLAMVIPPLAQDVVLLVNEEFDPARRVTVNDQVVALLPANLAMSAIHLPAAGHERRVVFAATGGTGRSLKVAVFIALALVAVFVVMSRRRADAPAG